MTWSTPLVVPGVPYHIVHSGNGRPMTFYCDADYRVYRSLIATYSSRHGIEVWAYCLMPNHVHLIAVPGRQDSIRNALTEAHRYYTRHINLVKNWSGQLWHGRLALYPMDEEYLIAVARYIEMLPVHARLSEGALNYPWSSARAHCHGKDDELVRVKPLLDRTGDWRSHLQKGFRLADVDRFKLHAHTGRPLGSEEFVREIEQTLSRIVKAQKPGRKRKGQEGSGSHLSQRIEISDM